MAQNNPFNWRHYEPEIILRCVRWYLRYSLSYRDLEEMMVEHGLHADHSTIYRWVQRYAPDLENASVPSSSLLTTPGRSTRPTCVVHRYAIKVHGDWYYLYRAIDSAGNTLEFMLSPTRDARAAECFCRKLLDDKHTVKPQVIHVDKNAAYPAAFKALQEEGELAAECRLRQVKYLNNLVEQDHRFIKRRMKPGLGFSWFRTAWATIRGYEAINQLRKGQVEGTSKGDISSQVRFINRAFGLAA